MLSAMLETMHDRRRVPMTDRLAALDRDGPERLGSGCPPGRCDLSGGCPTPGPHWTPQVGEEDDGDEVGSGDRRPRVHARGTRCSAAPGPIHPSSGQVPVSAEGA